jgi:hypothetical protein
VAATSVVLYVPPVAVFDLVPVEEGGVPKGAVTDVAGEILIVWIQRSLVSVPRGDRFTRL